MKTHGVYVAIAVGFALVYMFAVGAYERQIKELNRQAYEDVAEAQNQLTTERIHHAQEISRLEGKLRTNADTGQFLFVDLDADGLPVDHKFGRGVTFLKIGNRYTFPDWIDEPRIEGPGIPQYEKLWLDRDPRVFKPVISQRVRAKYPQ